MIGIFDSGLGGLTTLKEITSLNPKISLVYFGDTGRVPYGTRSNETIRRYAEQDASFLVSKNVDAIVVACGTVSTTALSHLKSKFSVPIVGVVEPSASAAVKATKNKIVAVIGTTATIRSGAYEDAIHALDPSVKVISRACPLFVPLVENGFTSKNDPITALTVERYLSDIKNSGADTIILGCTHYPIISEAISDYLTGVTMINSGAEAAKEAMSLIKCDDESPSVSYYVSDDPSSFEKNASTFLGSAINGSVTKINIEQF